ncbi:MAG: response regulator transcription factor [Actinobacteria bacterium]|nr:response regulator transcription factor [Actinomycetota bacterium]
MPKLVYTVDDEENILEIINFNLQKNGYVSSGFNDGASFFKSFYKKKPDLVILDLMLPDMDGYDICKKIKSESDIPVIILSAKSEELDKVLGLELGADDYIVKPFGVKELLARVKNILKRFETLKKNIDDIPVKNTFIFNDIKLEVNEERHEVSANGHIIDLNPKEYRILILLLKNINNVTKRNDLIRIVWGEDYYGDTRTLDVHVRRIREKMSFNNFGPDYIKTVHGIGYKLVDKKAAE